MANKRILVRRRKSVRNIRKITRTMQLIATSRFQAAFKRATASKPYTEKLAELVASLSSGSESIDHPLLEPREEAKTSVLLVISSNRGLCGGYNTNVLRTALGRLDELAKEGVDTEVQMIGRKGAGYFKFLGRPVARETTDISDKPQFAEIEPMANALMERFVKGEIASVQVAYMRFISASKQKATVMPLLPLTPEDGEDETSQSAGPQVEFEYSPEPKALLDELLPATVRVRLFQCFIEATVSEQIARMVAMTAATDAAGDMITALTRKYNRARQTQITMELLDIIGGVEAMA